MHNLFAAHYFLFDIVVADFLCCIFNHKIHHANCFHTIHMLVRNKANIFALSMNKKFAYKIELIHQTATAATKLE